MATDLSPCRAAELRSAVDRACAHTDLDSTDAELIKYTVNAVFRLKTSPVVVRVGTGEAGEIRGTRIVDVTRWLASHGASIAPLLDVPQPLHLPGGFTVTFWQELDNRPPWSGAELARPLKELHQIHPDDPLHTLPVWNPFDNARRRLAEADGAATRTDLDWLRDAWSAAEAAYKRWEPELPMGIIHGDPHTGNLLRDRSGRVVLCDLDETGIGPLGWDLVPQAVGAVRFNRPNFYQQFVAAYGADVRDDPCWPVLARVRELIMVTSVLPDLGQRPAVAAQHAHRLRTLRTEQADATWSLYT
ncbi:phosphotransferase enzyme family protein [Nocardia gipuzkoensis]|uniref:phosphotransferase enzyme family protein n=1 Tax=Nocardia gipuzkoensis TaxID=2749991 RepID=UPI00237DF0E9|nr:aminoglycoside phosphotransferase family protein [Nocardia gipuzkoensis]MDE1674742.1 aminoglycoside phosphotransferase family protein [Nocardia gipuzkoensis]